MVVDPDDQLVDRRLGRAISGELAGHLVLLERYTDDAWLLYWSNPEVPAADVVIGRDVGDRLLPTMEDARSALNEELEVCWLSEPEATTLKRKFFSHAEPKKGSVFSKLSQWLRGRAGSQ